MPKEKKKRGRRAEQAQRKAQEDQSRQFSCQTPLEFYDTPDQAAEIVEHGGTSEGDGGLPFFGLLDDQEHEYFRLQAEILEADTFESDEDRTAFVNSFFREAEGKLLKLANSQGCSRLLERMMALASPEQLKMTFRICSGNFLHLVQHRFASHFCESLFVHSAVVVHTEEEEDRVLGVIKIMDTHGESMESLFLETLNELESTLHTLLAHPFASHTIRVLLLVFSGQGTNTPASNNLIQSRKKENQLEAGKLAGNRRIPDSFMKATTRILTNMSVKMNVRELRILALHPVGSPALQFFVWLELAGASDDTKKSRKRNKREPQSHKTLLKMLLSGDESGGEESASSFLQSLFYDSVGSHLLETIIMSSSEQTFDELYETYFRERVVSLARNEQASYAAARIVGRLAESQLTEIIEALVPSVSKLLERSLTNVLKAVIDRSITQNLDASKLVKAIADTYRTSDTASVVFKMLKISEQELLLQVPALENVTSTGRSSKERMNPAQMHGSLLAQSILQLPDDSSSFINESLLAQTPTTMVGLCSHPTASHLVQASLTSPHASIIHKRKIFNLLAGHFAQLAISPSGSHLVDACWNAAQGMNNYWKGIAQELVAREADVRASLFGRIVWRNWAMDTFKTRRGDWVKLGKCEEGAGECYPGFTGTAPGSSLVLANEGVKKSAIQLARERRAAQRKQKEKFLARVINQGNAANSNNGSHEGGSATASKDRKRKREGREDVGSGISGAGSGGGPRKSTP